ncbi:MAG: hypothetical protein JSU82_11910 [Rhodospirillales bacterium]|nr:MAG: hypothetical protein JSU82_11910 [Rhodospirillales bacterium]
MRRFRLILILASQGLWLASCATSPQETASWPDITFTSSPALEFDVAEIKIATPYREPIEPPHVGEQFPVSPSRAARNWAEDRLRAVGRRGSVIVTIEQSSAVEEPLEQKGGLTGLVTKQQSERYTVVIAMKIEALDPVGPRVASATTRTKKSVTVREDATLDEREQTWYQLTQDTMAAFDSAMEGQIRKTLAGFLVR